MSRVDIEGQNFDLAFGVDHYTGAFVQLWIKPMSEQDGAAVKIASFGVYIDQEQASHLSEEVNEFLKHQKARFDEWRKNNLILRAPNIDEQIVINLAKCAGGFPDITEMVYKTFE